MKILSLIGATLLFCAGYSLAQEKAAIQNEPAAIVYDFGMINKDAAVSRIFKLYNNTGQTVRIRSIWASPYCHVQAWSTKPIKPGKHGLMKVSYNGAEAGPFKANLKVLYYGGKSVKKDGLIEDVVIQGVVQEDKQGGRPDYVNNNR